MNYVELKCKSNFSFLRGASDAREYIQRASELCLPAIGITDVNGVYALPRAYEMSKDFPGVKLISGAEITMQNHPSITLIARDRDAYGVLCRILTQAHADKEKDAAFLSWDELSRSSGLRSASGLIAIPELTSKTELGSLKDLFQDRLYLPLTRYLDGMDQKRTHLALEATRKFDLKIVATNDVHYHVPERRKLQDCLVCIREGTDLRNAGFKLFGNEERYLKSPFEMASLFRDLPQALKSTLEIAESCTFSLKELKYVYPIEWIPEGHTSQSYFESLVLEGAREEYPNGIPDRVAATIEKEFKLIRKLDYSSYFLTIHDIVQFANSKNILCQGRGSAANSICCYFLGITAVNPVDMNLLFERFLNEHRAEPPDIDVDFEHERREEVIQWIYERYGRERAGMVAAVRTYQHRSSFLELSKAIGIQTGTISASELSDDFEKYAGQDIDKRPLIEQLAEELEDFPRHLSIHTGGFTLSQDPLIETVPIQPARMENRTIVQWDKDDLDTVGLLKVDVLSLGFLTALHKVCNLITQTREKPFHWRQIPSNDEATYDMICRADTEGTFQIESRAQRSMLTRTRPRTFYDLVVQVAIVRPGPNVGEMIHPYIKRKEAERRGQPIPIPDLDDPILNRILKRTYGVPIFQEQIMQIAIEKAGFDPGEADQLRRSLGLIRSAGDIQRVTRRLYEGLRKNGVSEAYTQELLGYVKGYSHYGFPESHAASFASISYKSAYLKCHYPAEFLCGLINSQPMGFYPVDTLVSAAKRDGVTVLPIEPNISGWDAQMENGSVRMGFRNVRSLNREAFSVLERERAIRPFSDLLDFVQRTRFSREVIELLSLADAFQCFGLDQRHTLWEAIEHQTLFDRHENDQLPLFTDAHLSVKPVISTPIFTSMTLYEEMMAQYHAMGYSIHGNLMKALRAENPALPKATSHTLRQMKDKQWITLSGILMVIQRPPTAKGTCFLTLEDEFGSIDAILRSDVFERDRQIISNSRILQLHGRVQVAGTAHTIMVSQVTAPRLTHSIRGKNVYHGMHPRELRMDFEDERP